MPFFLFSLSLLFYVLLQVRNIQYPSVFCSAYPVLVIYACYGQVFLWLTGCINYMWSYLFALLFLNIYISLLRGKSLLDKKWKLILFACSHFFLVIILRMYPFQLYSQDFFLCASRCINIRLSGNICRMCSQSSVEQWAIWFYYSAPPAVRSFPITLPYPFLQKMELIFSPLIIICANIL